MAWPPATRKITIEYDGLGDTPNTSAKLYLGHYALLLSAATGTQFDLSG
jgi:hypothetical protein